LIDLDHQLRLKGSGLIVLKGKPEQEILKLVHEYQVKKVFTKKEVAPEELIIQNRVKNELVKANCGFETIETNTLYHPNDLPFQLNEIPDIFTNFRKKIEQESSVRGLFETPSKIKSPKTDHLNTEIFNDWEAKNNAPDKRAAIYFKGGETEALKRLSSYLFDTKNILTYKQTRNGMVGNAYSSKLSAWLSLGCISPRHVYTEIKKFEKQFEANESTYWLIFELIWRDYFYFLMNKFGTKFFKLNGIKNKTVANKNHDSNLFETWKNGHTGNDFIDANMIELKLTGFMSNRGRQNVASYLCHDLKLDWRMGATYFEHQLIDYDVCSNWGNWAYLAGVGNDPRPNRKFNIDKQANDYDADKTFRNLWLK
jgi:deoxyribodipyrimidine photo-lyase